MAAVPSIALFRHRAYARFWCARVLSVLAVQMQSTAIGWQIYDAGRATGQSIPEAAFLLGAVGLAQFLPLLVLSLFGGQAADRYNRRAIIVICLGAKAAIAAALALASGMGPAQLIPVVFAMAALSGAINAFLPPATTAILPMLVPRAELPAAIAWGSLGFQSAIIMGPMFGGLLYAFGPVAPYSASLLAFACAALLLFITVTPPQEKVKNPRTIGMIVEGLRFVRDNKVVLGAMSLDLIVVLLAGAVALLPVFARDILHAGPAELGLLRASMGAGAAMVALVLALNPIRTQVGRWMFGATIIFGVATIVFGVSSSIWLTSAALAVCGGVDMISVYVRQTLIQLHTPDAMRGRVGAVSFVFISASNELGDFEAGLTARIFGPVLAVALGGGFAIGASFLWMRLFPKLAAVDGFEPVREEPAKPSA
jgi:MFS family permease